MFDAVNVKSCTVDLLEQFAPEVPPVWSVVE